jgi:hypothetical protein
MQIFAVELEGSNAQMRIPASPEGAEVEHAEMRDPLLVVRRELAIVVLQVNLT